MTTTQTQIRTHPPGTRHESSQSPAPPRAGHRPVVPALALALVAGSCTAAPGSADTMVTEQDLLGDIPVVLSVTRLAQPASRAPGTVTVIDRQMIDASGARTIPDLFRLVPGFYVGYKRGNQPMVTYHGLSDSYSRRLQVTVDGRSVYTAATGGVPWSDLALSIDDIKRIEVIRGPNTASYGANAFLAVINIYTYSGSEVPGNTAAGLHGSHHEGAGLYRHAGRWGNDTAYRITLSSTKDDLYDSKNDFRHTELLTLRADRRLTANDRLLLKFGLLSGVRGQGTRADGLDHHDSTGHSNYEQVRWERKLSTDADISVQLYHTLHQTRERYPLGGFPVNFDVSSERTDIELQHRFRPVSAVRVVWGLNARVDRARSPTYLPDGPQTYRSSRAFANLEWTLGRRLSVNAGGMFEHNNFTGADFSPRLGLSYTLRPNHTLRAIISRAIRVPTIAEEEANAHVGGYILVGNPNVRPERIVSRELGYYGVFAHRLNIDIKVYHDNIADLMTMDRDTAPYTFKNTDNVALTGTEIQADFRPTSRDRVFLGYAHTLVHGQDQGNNYTSSAPKNSVSLLLIHDFPGALEASAAYYYMDKVYPLDGDPLENLHRLDLRLSKGFRLQHTDGRVSLVGQSVLGDYQEYQTDTTFRRAMYASLELRF
jgi:iron complex outermembrane receptor protein